MFQIIENKVLTIKQLITMCRSKKKRIRKKWLKNMKNYRNIPDDKYYLSGNTIFCHPTIAETLRNALGHS